MRVLLDTHVLLWSSLGAARLPGKIAALIESPETSVSVSIASYWEMSIKAGLAKLDLHWDILTIEALAAEQAIVTAPISMQAINYLMQMPHHHKDPFDRLIAATILTSGFTLVSADPIFDSYGIARLWN